MCPNKKACNHRVMTEHRLCQLVILMLALLALPGSGEETTDTDNHKGFYERLSDDAKKAGRVITINMYPVLFNENEIMTIKLMTH